MRKGYSDRCRKIMRECKETYREINEEKEFTDMGREK